MARVVIRSLRAGCGRRDAWRHMAFRSIPLALVAACAPIASGPPANVPRERIWDPALACDNRGHVYAAALTQDSTGAPRFLFARSETAGDRWIALDPAPFGRARG